MSHPKSYILLTSTKLMTKSVRKYFNQWILQAYWNLNKACFNLDRISIRVADKGEYDEIQETIRIANEQIEYSIKQLRKLQSLFNDSRAKKIEV